MRIDTKGNLYLKAYEIHILAADLVLAANQTQPWGSASKAPLLSDERRNGLYFSGTVTSGDATHVYACAADRDCGSDLAAWRAAGTVKDLGACARGETYGGWLAAPSFGRIYTKTFAANDTATVCDPHENVTQMRTRGVAPPLYVSTAVTLTSSYDGNVSTVTDGGDSQWFVFPIERKDIVVDAVRVWIRTDQYGDRRYLDLKVEETADATPFEYEEIRSTPRVVRTYASDPTTGWTSVGGTAYRSDFGYGCFWCMDVPVTSPIANPAYIRIGNALANHFYEIELRYHYVPGAALTVR